MKGQAASIAGCDYTLFLFEREKMNWEKKRPAFISRSEPCLGSPFLFVGTCIWIPAVFFDEML